MGFFGEHHPRERVGRGKGSKRASGTVGSMNGPDEKGSNQKRGKNFASLLLGIDIRTQDNNYYFLCHCELSLKHYPHL